MTTTRCPNCGNRDKRFLSDNGDEPTSPDYTVLCTAPTTPERSSFDHLPIDDPDRRVCGLQWTPNDN